MATNKLLHFKTQNRFNEAVLNDEIPEDSIAFIQEGTEVYTHSTLYAHYDEYKDGGYNMNNCLNPGIYYGCTLGRPIGSTEGEYYALRVSNLGKKVESTEIPIHPANYNWKFNHDLVIEGYCNYDFNEERFALFYGIVDPQTSRPTEYNELWYSQVLQNSQANSTLLFYMDCDLPKPGEYYISFEIAALNTRLQNEQGIPPVVSDSYVDVYIVYYEDDQLIRIPYKVYTKERYADDRGTMVSYEDITTIYERIACSTKNIRVEVHLRGRSNANWFLFRKKELTLIEPEMDIVEQICTSKVLDHQYRRILYTTDRNQYESPFTLYEEWHSMTEHLDRALMSCGLSTYNTNWYLNFYDKAGVESGHVYMPNATTTIAGLMTGSDKQHLDDVYAIFSSTEDVDDIINKWTEIVAFLAGISETDTLKGLIEGIELYVDSQSISSLNVYQRPDNVGLGISLQNSSEFINTISSPQQEEIGSDIALDCYKEKNAVPNNSRNCYIDLGTYYYNDPNKFPMPDYGNFQGRTYSIIDMTEFRGYADHNESLILKPIGTPGYINGILKLYKNDTLVAVSVQSSESKYVIDREEIENMLAVGVVWEFSGDAYYYYPSKAGIMTAADKAFLDSAANGIDVFIDVEDDRLKVQLYHDSVEGEKVIIPRATSTTEGVMSADDKTKLDSLKDYSSIIKDMMSGYKVEFTVNPTIVHRNTAHSFVATATYPRTFKVDSITYTGAAGTQPLVPSDGVGTSVSLTKTLTPSDNIIFTATTKIDDAIEVIKNATVRVVDKIYYGFTSNPTIFVGGGGLVKPATTVYKDTYSDTSTGNADYFFILLPTTIVNEDITQTCQFTMGGAPVAMVKDSVITIDGATYNVYRTAASYTSGTTLNITIS